MDRQELPGSRRCVGCDGLTFRNREDGLCPRCAFEAEHLIEQIELEGLDRDLALMSRFDAYCRDRDRASTHVAVPVAGAAVLDDADEAIAAAEADNPTAARAPLPRRGINLPPVPVLSLPSRHPLPDWHAPDHNLFKGTG